MIKNRLIIGLSILTLIGGYFIYNHMIQFNQNYALVTIISILVLATGIFSLSDEGRKFWNFFKDVKQEFKKIYFPKGKEVLNGLIVVFVFCVFFLILIGVMDTFFLKLYNSLI